MPRRCPHHPKPAPGLSTANCRNLKQSALSRPHPEVLPARHNLLDTRIPITCPHRRVTRREREMDARL